jgi:hypothetical protein
LQHHQHVWLIIDHEKAKPTTHTVYLLATPGHTAEQFKTRERAELNKETHGQLSDGIEYDERSLAQSDSREAQDP